MFVGVDGCKAGWLAVSLTDEDIWEANVFPNVEELWRTHEDAELILIDMPIGLKDEGRDERRCDKLSRKLLKKPRSTSVFPVPCRPALYAEDDEAANNKNERLTGRRISSWTFGIMPKIREVDAFLARNVDTREHFREVHPELCFWALAGGRSMTHRKGLQEGMDERLNVLENLLPNVETTLDEISADLTGHEFQADDVLDAIAAALTAYLGSKHAWCRFQRCQNVIPADC